MIKVKRLKKYLFFITILFIALIFEKVNALASVSINNADYELVCRYADGLQLTIARDGVYIQNASLAVDSSSSNGIKMYLKSDQKNSSRDANGGITYRHHAITDSGKCPSKLYAYDLPAKYETESEDDDDESEDNSVSTLYYSTSSSVAAEIGGTREEESGMWWWKETEVVSNATRETSMDTYLVSEEVYLTTAKETTVCDYKIPETAADSFGSAYEVDNQFKFVKDNNYTQVDGFVLFSYKYLKMTTGNMGSANSLLIKAWRNGALLPSYEDVKPITDLPTVQLLKLGTKYYMSFNEVENANGYVLYAIPKGKPIDFKGEGVIVQKIFNKLGTGAKQQYNALTDYSISNYDFYIRIFDNSNKPIEITDEFETEILKIEAGDYCAFAIDKNGDVYAWGYNTKGNLGNGNLVRKKTPEIAISGLNIKELSAGKQHAVALTKDEKIYVWGYNDKGQLCFAFLNPAKASAGSNMYGADLTGVRIMLDVGHGGNEGVGVQPLAVEDHVGLDDAAAAAGGHAFALQDVLHGVELPALGAVVPMDAPVELQHVPAARGLVEAVDVLGDDGGELAVLLQLRQGLVGLVGFRVRVQEELLIIIVEDLRVPPEEVVAQQHLRGVAVGGLGLVDAVRAAKVGDAAFRGQARPAQKGDAATVFNDLSQFLVHRGSIAYSAKRVNGSLPKGGSALY